MEVPILDEGIDDWGDDEEFFEQSSKNNAKESSEPNENNKSNIFSFSDGCFVYISFL